MGVCEDKKHEDHRGFPIYRTTFYMWTVSYKEIRYIELSILIILADMKSSPLYSSDFTSKVVIKYAHETGVSLGLRAK